MPSYGCSEARGPRPPHTRLHAPERWTPPSHGFSRQPATHSVTHPERMSRVSGHPRASRPGHPTKPPTAIEYPMPIHDIPPKYHHLISGHPAQSLPSSTRSVPVGNIFPCACSRLRPHRPGRPFPSSCLKGAGLSSSGPYNLVYVQASSPTLSREALHFPPHIMGARAQQLRAMPE